MKYNNQSIQEILNQHAQEFKAGHLDKVAVKIEHLIDIERNKAEVKLMNDLSMALVINDVDLEHWLAQLKVELAEIRKN